MSFCDYHSNKHSRWTCTQCHKNLCDQCLVTEPNQGPVCGSCGGQVEYTPNKADVVPFWNRVGDFFAYPFQKDPIMLIAITLIIGVASTAIPFGWVLLLLWVFVQTKYGFSVIEKVANGKMEAPSLMDSISGGGFELTIKTIGVFILTSLMTFGASYLGAIPGIIASLFFTLALPMSIMILATQEDLISAVNPVNLMQAMWRIGWSYLLVYLYLIMMAMCSITLLGMLFEWFGLVAGTLTGVASFIYFGLVMYSLMGYLIHQFRFELQVGPSENDLKVRSKNNTQETKIRIALADGRFEKALDYIESEIKKPSFNPALLDTYQKTLAFTQHRDRLLTISEIVLKNLKDQDLSLYFSRILGEIWKHEPKWEMENGVQALEFSQYLNDVGDYQLSFRMLKNIYKNQRDNETRNDMLDLMAKLLRDNLNQPQMADKVLLIKQAPTQRKHTQVKKMPTQPSDSNDLKLV